MGHGRDRGATVARGAAAASVATFAAAAFHTLGGGEAPAPVTIVLTLAFAIPLCIALVGRRLPLVRLAAAVSLSQVLFHLLFTLGEGSGTAALPHLHGGAVHLPAMLGHAPQQMTSSHVAAALLTTVLLARGEAALRALLTSWRLSATRWRRLPAPVPLIPRPLPEPVAEPVHRLPGLILPLSLRHRGPPALAV
ncbi:hypothetical protein [Naasia aerilata]|uniref:Integral membrane protein n=1 Tax=Naasia aerilata TaxID=1162966 RepID=A0ABN6XKX0_9MICO|nr:hypothetical protein [Naasia aerilata]BDZ44251.1 hypothetical protein GCM10025866_01600 [Naasia aerilata]